MNTTDFSAQSAIPKRSKRIKSVEVAYRVLLAVQRGPSPVKLSEIANRCGLSSGAAHNYLTSLVNTGLVEQEDRGRYRLGPSAFALSLASFRQLNGYDVMRDAAQALHRRTGQSTAVSVWSQGGPVSVYIQRSDNTGSFDFRSGHLSMIGSGAGRLFIAYLPDEHTRALVAANLGVAEGSNVVSKLVAEVRKSVLRDGYARHDYDEGPTHFALSAPIWTEEGRIPFVLSIVVHEAVDAVTCAGWVEALRESADQASLLLNRTGADGPYSEFYNAQPGQGA